MNKFFSSLTVNVKKFPNVHQIFYPRYNKEYFKRLIKNIPLLEEQVNRRHLQNLLPTSQYESYSAFKADAQKLVSLKIEYDKQFSKQDDHNSDKQSSLQSQIQELEERLHHLVVILPNRSSKNVPENDTVVREIKSDFMSRQNLFKILSHRKLSFMNNCYSKSVVGPNSYFYTGIGAKLNHGLSDYFLSTLEEENFIPTSGMCLTKSAVVEAANHRYTKDFSQDPGRIVSEGNNYTGLHLVETSRESLLSLIAVVDRSSSNEPLRLMCSGSAYKTGSDWFDSDERNISQFQTTHLLSITPSIEQYSMKEYNQITNILWSLYEGLEIPCRLVHSSLSGMLANEYDAYRIEVWLPSEHLWVPVGRISHYLDFITVRAGMTRGHIIDATTYNSQPLIASIIENNQTSRGRFIIPNGLKRHMPDLSDEEEAKYFMKTGAITSCHTVESSNVLNNYEQRRYLSKRNYILSHSRKATRDSLGGTYACVVMAGVVFALFCILIDISELYLMCVPRPVRRFIYDYIVRFVKRAWWWYSYADDEERPPDLTFDELDHSWTDNLTYIERKKIIWARLNPELAARSVNKPPQD